MSSEITLPSRKRRKNTEFWRACRYLAPYRRIVIISIVCAFGVGVITTTGLGAMLPILRVLLNGETIQSSVDHQIEAHTKLTATAPNLPLRWRLAHEVASRMPTHPVKAIAICYSIIFVLSIFGSVVRFFQEYLSDKAAISAINDIRRHLYDHVLHTPLNFFNTQGTSDVTSRLVGDSQNLQDGFKNVLGQSIQEPIRAAFFF